MSPEQLNAQVVSDGAFLGWLVAATLLMLGLTRRRRYPHALCWLVFGGYALTVSLLPSLRALDADQAWCYGLRGVPAGLVLASMLRLRVKRSVADDAV